jgi:glycosyltransferase involved in cell wall biosynthesis
VKNFAFVSTIETTRWGGSEELWQRVAVWLASEGMNVRVNVKGWRPDPAPIQQLLACGVDLTRRRTRPPWAERFRRFLPDEPYRWLDQDSCDIVVISQGANFEGQFWASACRKRGIPYALIAQAAGELWWLDDPAADHVREAYEGAAASFFVSRANLELTQRQIGTAIPRAQVVRNPFNVSYDATPAWPAESGALRLACVARIAAKFKGQDLIIEALATPKWRDRPLHVTFYGAGPNERSLRHQAMLRDLSCVTFAGYVKDVEQIWAHNHALLLTSRVEGLPLAVVEAMLCGRACIVTDVAGNAELLEDNFSGFVAAAPTVPAVDEALERAWQRRHELPEIGARASEAVRRHVPRDPAEVFARILMGQIESTSGLTVRTPSSRRRAAAGSADDEIIDAALPV